MVVVVAGLARSAVCSAPGTIILGRRLERKKKPKFGYLTSVTDQGHDYD